MLEALKHLASAASEQEDLRAQFQDLHSPLSERQAALESARCLYCYDAPCTRICPTAIDVPSFIQHIAVGNLNGAAKTILQQNILGASCARVCPTEILCEHACVRNHDAEAAPVKSACCNAMRSIIWHSIAIRLRVPRPAARRWRSSAPARQG